jgi:hypothetical protein
MMTHMTANAAQRKRELSIKPVMVVALEDWSHCAEFHTNNK